MNLILVGPGDYIAPNVVRLADRRFQHIQQILRAAKGDELRVGEANGKMGRGLVTAIEATSVTLEVDLNQDPPAGLNLKLILALPRPKLLAKVLQTATSLGVKEIYLLNSFRVEKIYWSCQQIIPSEMRAACQLGLEQARDTVFPRLFLKPRFKPFVEDELAAIVQGTCSLVAHPGSPDLCPRGVEGPVSLAIGPEGGFIDYEIQKLREAGFLPVSISERILKVETAVSSLIGRLF